MKVIEMIAEMKEFVTKVKRQGKTIGFVPTMGFLHEGHLTLMRKAAEKTDFVVASIFVNPLQFGAGEDFEEYPRDLERDLRLAESAGVNLMFTPGVTEMYPSGYGTTVEVGSLTDKLCGRSRPGHFRGVTTVVTKLFNIVEPDIAFFGQKDAQQAAILNKMAADLNMNLEIKVVPIVRETDGLAMSSRNKYLSPEERKAALVLSQGLELARNFVAAGARNTADLISEITDFINREPRARIDYVEVLSFPGFSETENMHGQVIIALAVFIGGTRLIDNMVLEV
ncbi:pantoate--beta-alanine ligase [Phosphitispora fastidiosa]|uniref:pantoate--beta-alanine ligase n=1 Tax=Phosphitispora fastidiosa TaxID=2837202 RepID=UPI001E38B9DB